MEVKRGFASDNSSGVHPHILAALSKVNQGHTLGYGDDIFTKQAENLFKKQFGKQVETYFVLTGTGANIVGLQSVIQSYHSIICASTAHINVDECGAPEKFTGAKLISINTSNGKLSPDSISPHLVGFGFEHHAQPKVISITQSTEMGTVYSANEIKKLAELAHKHDMLLHVDGARIANAVAHLGISLKEMITDTGVDILSFGGTKNGMMFGEAIVLLQPQKMQGISYFRKQAAQLYSKMRFVAAQYIAYFHNDLWIKNASHSNKMAGLLYQVVKDIPEINITQKVQSNGIFAIIPPKIIAPIQEAYYFYMWDEHKNEVRWMTSFDTSEEDILNFASLLKHLLKTQN